MEDLPRPVTLAVVHVLVIISLLFLCMCISLVRGQAAQFRPQYWHHALTAQSRLLCSVDLPVWPGQGSHHSRCQHMISLVRLEEM